VSGSEFWTVEGNTSGTAYDRDGGEVAIKHYNINDGVGGTHHINGFGRPRYGDNTCTADEMVEILKAEVGYGEKATDKDLDSKSANVGKSNFTKYGKWIGQNGEPWCQSFQSWCAWQACAKHMASIKTGWRNEDGGWRWYDNDISARSCWKEIGGYWYAFDSDGLARSGWWETPDGWYYFDPASCKMKASAWIKYKDSWYYLTRSGIMATSAYAPDNGGRGWCWMQSDGIWNGNYTRNPDTIYDRVS
jgi:glucan-binding YG repeat protein